MAVATIVMQVKDDGSDTIRKVSSALKQMREEGAAGASALGTAWQNVKGTIGLLGIGLSGHALLAFTKDAVEHSRAAERAMSQLTFAVNAATNNAFPAYKNAVLAAVDATAQYAIVQQETAGGALQLLITNTGKLQESQANLNLVFDLAAAKHMDVASAARIVSLAMEGNVTALRKQLPEFTELNEQLEKHAIRSDRAAVAVAFMHDKLDGASRAVGVHIIRQKELAKVREDFIQGFGAEVDGFIDRSLNKFIGDSKIAAGSLLALTGNMDAARLAWADGRRQVGLFAEAETTATAATNAAAAATNAAAAATTRGTAALDALNKIGQQHAETEYRERLATDLGTAALKAKTEAVLQLSQAETVLNRLAAEGAQAELVRGAPEDALRRIKQAAFEGTAGTSITGLEGLISTTKGLTGADEEDKARVLRDLNESLRILATSQASTARERGGLLTPQQQQALERSGGQSTGPTGFGQAQFIAPGGGSAFDFSGDSIGAFGLRQPIATQPRITVGDIIINGADDPRETAKRVREEILRLQENS